MDGEISIDTERQCVQRAGRPVALTAAEWRVVAVLANGTGHAVPRAEIARILGGDSGDASDNAVAVHLYNLRRKLGRHAIETIRGRGFRLRR
jgi:two-component system, OmpR family, response regulator